MKIKLYFFGKKNEITAFEKEMHRRINFRSKFELLPIPQAGITEPKKAKKIEAESFLKKLPPKAFLIAFDENGVEKNSLIFSTWLKDKLVANNEVYFVIGGAHGLDTSILERANIKLRFGSMIWTRNLFRQMACEQIYRALEIDGGSNFHKE